MKWLRRHRRKEPCPEAMARLEEYEQAVEELAARGERAVTVVEKRHRRNHWGQTISETVRGGRP